MLQACPGCLGALKASPSCGGDAFARLPPLAFSLGGATFSLPPSVYMANMVTSSDGAGLSRAKASASRAPEPHRSAGPEPSALYQCVVGAVPSVRKPPRAHTLTRRLCLRGTQMAARRGRLGPFNTSFADAQSDGVSSEPLLSSVSL